MHFCAFCSLQYGPIILTPTAGKYLHGPGTGSSKYFHPDCLPTSQKKHAQHTLTLAELNVKKPPSSEVPCQSKTSFLRKKRNVSSVEASISKKMEISDKTHKFSCDFGKEFNDLSLSSRSRGRHVTDGAGKLSRRKIVGPSRRFRWGKSGLATPIVQWKLGGATAVAGGERIRRRVQGGGMAVAVSARKLAAGMWHLAAFLNSGCGIESGGGMTWHGQHGRFDQLHFGLQSPSPISKSVMEGDTNWDHTCPNAPSANEVCQFHSKGRLLNSQKVATISVGSALQVELVRARTRVKELESERHLIKKKLKQLLRSLSEEKASWMRREHQKMLLKIADLKGELQRERRNYQKMEFVNSKLLSDLTDAKLSAKQFKQDYEKEKNARELLEDICRDLGKDIEDHQANIRAMKVECARIQEEVEEERKMMQMAEVWREERVQMKLIDAKLILEEKCCQMNNLIADLETLLRSSATTPDVFKTSDVEGISLAIDSISIQDIRELCHTAPVANDLHTISENPQDSGTLDTGNQECPSHFSGTHSFRFHNVSHGANEFTNNCSIDQDRIAGNASFRETMTCDNSSYTLGDSACSVDGITGGRYISSAIGNNQNANQESLNSKTNKISSTDKHKNKGASLRKLWSSTPRAADILRTISANENGRLSNGSNSSSVAVSPEKLSEEALNHNELVDHWCLPGQRNPHIARAMRGCIEWPRGIQRYGLKAKLLEASLENQKKHLHNFLSRGLSK